MRQLAARRVQISELEHFLAVLQIHPLLRQINSEVQVIAVGELDSSFHDRGSELLIHNNFASAGLLHDLARVFE